MPSTARINLAPTALLLHRSDLREKQQVARGVEPVSRVSIQGEDDKFHAFRAKLPVDVIDKIIQLTHACRRKAGQFSVEERLSGHILHLLLDYHRRRLDRYSRITLSKFRRIEKLAIKLADEILTLSEAQHELLVNVNAGTLETALPGGSFSYQLLDVNALRNVLVSAAGASRALSLKPKNGYLKSSGRPKQSVKNPGLFLLVKFLYRTIVTEAGGRLTLRKSKDRGSELKGTLPQVLEILHPYLPTIIPKGPSYSTLRRVLQKVVLEA